MTKEELWEQYEELSILSEDDHPLTILAKERNSRRLAIVKQVDGEHLNIYEKLAKLEHPNLVKIYQCVRTNSNCYVIEEFNQGPSLEEEIMKKGPMEEKEAIGYICQLCDVLHLVHKEEIVHRDVSPSNVLLGDDGVIKLIDFGISRVHKEEARQDTTIMGTPGFAAPELFGYSQTDRRADIYAVGVLLNWLLTGKMPNEEIYKKNRFVYNTIQKCIAVDKRQRFNRVLQIRGALTKAPTLESPKLYILLRQIPGFRTMRLWKILVSLYVYISCILAFSGVYQCDRWTEKATIIFVSLWILTSFWLLCNFTNVDDRLLGWVPGGGAKLFVKLVIIMAEIIAFVLTLDVLSGWIGY